MRAIQLPSNKDFDSLLRVGGIPSTQIITIIAKEDALRHSMLEYVFHKVSLYFHDTLCLNEDVESLWREKKDVRPQEIGRALLPGTNASNVVFVCGMCDRDDDKRDEWATQKSLVLECSRVGDKVKVFVFNDFWNRAGEVYLIELKCDGPNIA